MIRRLNASNDREHFVTAWGWLESSPSWRQATEAIFGADTLETYLYNAADEHSIAIGVFDNELVAVFSLTLRGKATYEAHLAAKRGTDPELVARAGCVIRAQLEDYGMQHTFAWVPRWNRPLRYILKANGFTRDHIVMFRGVHRGRIIEWCRYSWRR